MGPEVLGLLPPWVVEPFPKCHKQGSVPGEDHPGPKVQTARIPGQLAKDDGDIFKGCSISREAPMGHRGGVGTVGSWFAVGQPEEAIAGKRRIHGHIQEAPLSHNRHWGHTTQRRRQIALRVHNPQPTGLFRDDDGAVGKKVHSPWLGETSGHNAEEKGTLLSPHSTGLGTGEFWRAQQKHGRHQCEGHSSQAFPRGLHSILGVKLNCRVNRNAGC